MSVFLNDWSDIHDLKRDFEISDEVLEGVEILYASYTYEDYSGSAVVVFKKGSELFLVEGSHCSCYGLEGQWAPEETNIEVLERMSNGHWYDLGGSDYDGTIENNRTAFKNMLVQLRIENA